MNIQGFEPVTEEKGRVLQWVKNDRMAGFVPAWVKSSETSKTEIQGQLDQSVEKFNPATGFKEALSYQQSSESDANQSNEFGFGDLVDMINPLQHIPLLNLAYREFTGDEIKPIGKIIGGAVFGGPMGVASGIVDAIVTQETGKDMAGNAVALMERNIRPNKEEKEDYVLALLDQQPMAIQNTVSLNPAVSAYERVQFSDARTAGTITRYA